MSVVKHNIFYELLMIWYAFLVSHASVFKAKVNARSSTPPWHAFFVYFVAKEKSRLICFLLWPGTMSYSLTSSSSNNKKKRDENAYRIEPSAMIIENVSLLLWRD